MRAMTARRLLVAFLCLLCMVFVVRSFAQEGGQFIDKSRIPAEGNSVKDFIPPGWIIEDQVVGDLNNDSLPDLALKLIQDKASKEKDEPEDRRRALVILFRSKDGRFFLAAVADRLLQCTRCGGAFYGFVEAPANVKIEKGVLIVIQDHGSRNVIEDTYRFRYEEKLKRFVLIGADLVNEDRLTGITVTESTNFLTGTKIVERSAYNKRLGKNITASTMRKKVPKKTVFIEQLDFENR